MIGGKDPGVYVNEGIQIAQRGSSSIAIRSSRRSGRSRAISSSRTITATSYYSLRFMGFFLPDPETGATVGQFPHLFPASIAIGYGIDGLTGARRTRRPSGRCSASWPCTSSGRAFSDGPAAAAAAALLALNVIQVWFSRYPNAEVVMQALGFAALLASARDARGRRSVLRPGRRRLAALLLFVRIDAVLIVGALVGGLLLGRAAGQRLRWSSGCRVIVAAAALDWYLFGPMRAYAELPVDIPVVPALVGLCAAWRPPGRPSRPRRRRRRAPPAHRRQGIVRWAATGADRRGAGAGRIRDVFCGIPAGVWPRTTRTRCARSPRLYFTLPALVAALIGYFDRRARSAFWRDPAFMLALTGFALFFFYKIRIVPDQFWMARRFVPVILPGALLLASAAALTGVRGQRLVRSGRYACRSGWCSWRCWRSATCARASHHATTWNTRA